jgi:hypothetical protein
VSQQVWHYKDSSLFKGSEHGTWAWILQPFINNVDNSMKGPRARCKTVNNRSMITLPYVVVYHICMIHWLIAIVSIIFTATRMAWNIDKIQAQDLWMKWGLRVKSMFIKYAYICRKSNFWLVFYFLFLYYCTCCDKYSSNLISKESFYYPVLVLQLHTL